MRPVWPACARAPVRAETPILKGQHAPAVAPMGTMQSAHRLADPFSRLTGGAGMGRPLCRRSSCRPRLSRRPPLVVRQQGRTPQLRMRWPVLSWNRRVDRPESAAHGMSLLQAAGVTQLWCSVDPRLHAAWATWRANRYHASSPATDPRPRVIRRLRGGRTHGADRVLTPATPVPHSASAVGGRPLSAAYPGMDGPFCTEDRACPGRGMLVRRTSAFSCGRWLAMCPAT